MRRWWWRRNFLYVYRAFFFFGKRHCLTLRVIAADQCLLTLLEHKRCLFLKGYADTPVERRIRLIGIEVFLVGFAGDLGDFLRSKAKFYQDPPCRIRTIAG